MLQAKKQSQYGLSKSFQALCVFLILWCLNQMTLKLSMYTLVDTG